MKGKAGIGILLILGLTINFGVYLKGQRTRSTYKVTKVEGKTITINAGRRDGVRVGYEGKAYKEAQFQGRSIQITTCEFRVVWVGANSSRAEVSSVSPSDPPAPGQKVAFREELVPQGQIYITSVPMGAEVFMGRQRLGVTPFRLWLEPGAYTLRLTKANYKEAEISVVVESGQVVRRNVNLTPSVTYRLTINSNPSEADVYLDGQLKGRTPFVVSFSKPRTCQIRLEKEGYLPEERVVTVSYPEKILNIKMKREEFILKINSQPEKATVYLNEEIKGETPLEMKLPPGKYKIRLEKRGYNSVKSEIDLQSNEERQFNLIENKYTFSLNSTPSKAKVYIDGELVGVTPLKLRLGAGKYKVKVEKEEMESQEFEVDLNHDIEKTVKLNPISYGELLISCFPYAKVEIDGVKYGEVPPILKVRVKEGEHRIKFISEKLNKEKEIIVYVAGGEKKRCHEILE